MVAAVLLLMSYPLSALGSYLGDSGSPSENRPWWLLAAEGLMLLFWLIPAVLMLVGLGGWGIASVWRPGLAPAWYRADLPKMLGLCVLSCAIGLPVLAYCEGHPFGSVITWLCLFFACLCWGISAALALVALMLVVAFLGPFRTAFDRRKGGMTDLSGLLEFPRFLPFSRIDAVQLVPFRTRVGFRQAPTWLFQVNLATSGTPKPRMKLCEFRNPEEARQVAQAIAEFIRVAPMNHHSENV